MLPEPKCPIFLVLLFLNVSIAFSQTSGKTTTLENGVVIHQAHGVEKEESTINSIPERRDIDQWSLEECIWAIDIIESKLNAAVNKDQRMYYTDQLKAVNIRIEQLKRSK